MELTTERWVQLLRWPVAVVIVIVFMLVVADEIATGISDNNERQRISTTCIQRGGSLGQENGWATCTKQ